jgi:hypothetical protein
MTTKSATSLEFCSKRTRNRFQKPMMLVVIFLAMYSSSFPQTSATDHDWIRSEIYFGQTYRNGKPISNKAWQRFAGLSLSSSFHDGFTMIRAAGEWTDEKGHHYKEPTRVLIVVYPKAQAQVMDEAIRRVTSQYIREFNQESVLRIDSKADATFYR